ncbi:DUF4446 family protein [Clostridium senegalense]|uniref:DUF4446 family protein n=1 Tax=Clostridium senegalense TaxID=1465809 RepID=A0A6M0H3C4_9CLOT|nr:DUF4446 family protein [Clostridium senegalense]NEU04381.1 DUF4446 family protein [Clostridium senegalense]
MTQIFNIINQYSAYITIALLGVLAVFFIVLIVTLSSLNRLEKKYRRLMRGSNNKNLEELILKYLDTIDEVKNNNNEIKEICKNTQGLTNNCIQKFSIIRYKAFEDVGSDLSYSIAFLDANNDGVLLTSIYGRNESTTYAKPIDKGISRYDLSEEEERVLHEAINK